jgi:predicted metalloprotease
MERLPAMRRPTAAAAPLCRHQDGRTVGGRTDESPVREQPARNPTTTRRRSTKEQVMKTALRITGFTKKFAVLTAVAALAITGAFAGEAKAVAAPYSVDGVIAVVNGDLEVFWRNLWPANRRPTIYYYNYVNQYNQVQEWNTGCGSTATAHGFQGFYCATTWNGEIFFDFSQQREQLMRVGDGATALWAAHEYAHHAERMLNISWPVPYHELLADCFAGLYFRYGVNVSRKLAYADYLEARTMLSQMLADRDHGTPAQRIRAFDYGYSRIGYTSCTNGWQNW